jgi:hypothetical protein
MKRRKLLSNACSENWKGKQRPLRACSAVPTARIRKQKKSISIDCSDKWRGEQRPF